VKSRTLLLPNARYLNLSTFALSRRTCASVLGLYLSEFAEAVPSPYPRPGFPFEPDLSGFEDDPDEKKLESQPIS
jgi:hypothetical protein